MEATIVTRRGCGDQLVRELRAGRKRPLQRFELHRVRQRVLKTSAISQTSRDLPNRLELLTRRIPTRSPHVVEADDDPNELMRGQIVDLAQLGQTAAQVRHRDAGPGDQTKEPSSTGDPTCTIS